jgi:hypothetical protein
VSTRSTRTPRRRNQRTVAAFLRWVPFQEAQVFDGPVDEGLERYQQPFAADAAPQPA